MGHLTSPEYPLAPYPSSSSAVKSHMCPSKDILPFGKTSVTTSGFVLAAAGWSDKADLLALSTAA